MRAFLATILAAIAGAAAIAALAATRQSSPQPVLTTRLNEENPAAGGGYFAWSRNSRARLRRYDAYVRRGRSRPIKLNAPRTEGWIGGISGTTLVYQQSFGRFSDLKFFDLATRKRSYPPKGFNTRGGWEWHPSISGDWVLFGRSAADTDYIILRGISTGRQIVLDKLVGAESSNDLAPGQVNGNYAVWAKCEASTCTAFRYAIAEGLTTPIPAPPGRFHYGPSVNPSGTVYVARSGRGCGSRVEIWRYPLVGLPSVMLTLRRGQDFRFSYADQTAPGMTDVYYDRVACRRKTWDIYKVVDGEAPTP